MKKIPEKFDIDLIDDMHSVASATECTGLYPTPPENDWEKDAYCELYPMQSKRNKKVND